MYKQILELINKLAMNMSVSPEEIREDLRGLRDEIEMLIDATEADIKAQEMHLEED